MTEQSVKFHSYDEVCSRPAFDPTYEISPSNFKGLIGTYLFRDDQICQVRTDKRDMSSEAQKWMAWYN